MGSWRSSSLPFVRPFIVLMAGIFTAECFEIRCTAAYPAGLFVATILSMVIKRRDSRFGALRSALLFCVVFLSGIWLQSEGEERHEHPPPEGKIKGVLHSLSEPVCRNQYCRFRAHFILPAGRNVKVNLRVHRNRVDTLAHPATYAFEGSFSHNELPRNPFQYDPSEHARRQGIAGSLHIDSMRFINRGAHDYRNTGRKWLLKALSPMRDERSKAMSYALLTGDKSALPDELRTHFARCGIMHLLAVSGLHAALIAWFPLLMLRYAHRKFMKKLWALVAITVVWGFAWFTGLSASVVRAAMMLSMVATGMAFFKRVASLNALSGAGIFMLVSDASLLFNAGFLLSFAAVASIVSWTPILVDLLPPSRYRFLRNVVQSSAVAVAAQAGTTPISTYFFGQLPLLFLPANLIAVPLGTLLLYLVLINALVHMTGLTAHWLIFILDTVGSLLITIAESISNMPFAAVDGLAISWHEAVVLALATLVLFAIMADRRRRNFYKLLPYVLVLLLFAVHKKQHTHVVVFSQSDSLLVGISGRVTPTLIAMSSATSAYPASGWMRRYNAKRVNLERDTMLQIKSIPIERKGDALYIGNSVLYPNTSEIAPRRTDGVIVLTGKRRSYTWAHCSNFSTKINLDEFAFEARINSVGGLDPVPDQHRPPSQRFLRLP